MALHSYSALSFLGTALALTLALNDIKKEALCNVKLNDVKKQIKAQ